MNFTDGTQPLASILINNYNYGRYLADAIDSALGQTYPNTEVIVVDDGSTDHSRDVIQQYGDRIIAVFKENGGQASALNAGFAASRGEIIFLLDADDAFLPEKVAEVVQHFQLHPEIDWFFTESAPIEARDLENTDIKTLFKSIFAANSEEIPRIIDFRANLKNAELPGFTPSTSNLCFSRRISEKMFPLPEVKGLSGLAICDAYLKLLAVGLGVGCASKRNLGLFRIHQSNLYTTQEINKKRMISAEISIATAYWMRVNFPEFTKLSQKLFAKGMGTYLKSRTPNKNLDELIKDYRSSIAVSEKFEINCMALYYFLKLHFTQLV